MADLATTALQAAIVSWSAVLQADAVAPQPTYELDGKSVDQNEWRTSILKLITDAQDAINQRSPNIIWTRAGCRGGYG